MEFLYNKSYIAYLNMGLNRFTKQKLNKEQTFNNVKKHLGYI